jgi:hypothetical protein
MSSAPEERIPEDDETTEAPLTMAASVVLTNLPRDASKALETAGNLTVQKSKCGFSYLLCPSLMPAELSLVISETYVTTNYGMFFMIRHDRHLGQ